MLVTGFAGEETSLPVVQEFVIAMPVAGTGITPMRSHPHLLSNGTSSPADGSR